MSRFAGIYFFLKHSAGIKPATTGFGSFSSLSLAPTLERRVTITLTPGCSTTLQSRYVPQSGTFMSSQLSESLTPLCGDLFLS